MARSAAKSLLAPPRRRIGSLPKPKSARSRLQKGRRASALLSRKRQPSSAMRGGRLVFQRACQKILDGQLARLLFNKTQQHWYAGLLSPSAYKRRVDALEDHMRHLVRFCASALIDGTLRPMNSNPRRIRDDDDWAEAVEALDGFRDMLIHKVAAVPPPKMTSAERRELARYCAARGSGGKGCEAPCGKVRGVRSALLRRPAAKCAVKVGPAARDRVARAAGEEVGRIEKQRARAKRPSVLSPSSPRGSPYARSVPAQLPFRDLRFRAIQKHARAAGARLVGKQGKSMSYKSTSA